MNTGLTAAQKARTMGREGYALSASTCIGLYEVWQPGNTHYQTPLRNAPYIIDTRDGEIRCNCPASVKVCKHVEFFLLCRRYWLTLERKAKAAAPAPARRHFSHKHIEALRQYTPVLAAPKAAPAPVAIDPERAAKKARITAMMLADFGPAS